MRVALDTNRYTDLARGDRALADRLERAGAVERSPGADRRVKLLRLTDAGEHQREQLAEAVSRGSTVMAKLNKQQRGD